MTDSRTLACAVQALACCAPLAEQPYLVDSRARGDARADSDAEPPGADSLDELNPYAAEASDGAIEPGGLDRARGVLVVHQIIEWATEHIAQA